MHPSPRGDAHPVLAGIDNISSGAAPVEAGSPRTAAVWALALSLAAFLIYIFYPQRGLYSDGIFYLRDLEQGAWRSQYLTYFPLVHCARLLLSPVHAITMEDAIRLVSAVGGAAGVGLWFLTGRLLLKSNFAAGVAAAMIIFIPGYWFNATATEVHTQHGAFSALLIYGIVSVLIRSSIPARAWLIVAAGAALTPGSHLSGVAAAPPCLAAIYFSRHRWKLFSACAAGGILFLFGYFMIARSMDRIRNYETGFNIIYSEMFKSPSKWPRTIFTATAELFIYASPASTLVPAGFRVIARSARPVVWIFGLAFIGYFLLCAPTEVLEMGCYYVPTIGMQALLAIAAYREIAKSPGRALTVIIVAFAPALVTVFSASRDAGTIVWAFASAFCWFLIPPAAPESRRLPRSAFLAPFFTCILTALAVARDFKNDPVRDRAAAVAEIAGAKGCIILADFSAAAQATWLYYYQHRGSGAAPFIMNLFEIDWQTGAEINNYKKKFVGHIERILGNGDGVWLVGDLEIITPGTPPGDMLAEVTNRYALTRNDSYPSYLLKITKK
ncbi:MAG: DUF2723 domain-containing protein [Planctomycetes bacterium]|nr:DUF2723 domain-containing protein [Planctomycetota bacterium]